MQNMNRNAISKDLTEEPGILSTAAVVESAPTIIVKEHQTSADSI